MSTDDSVDHAAAEPANPALASLRFGAYQAVRELGKGATSTVYLAEKKFERLQVNEATPDGGFPALLMGEAKPAPLRAAIKVVNFTDESTKLSRRFRKLFATEAWVATQLDHPNITKVYDWAIEDDRAYLIMDYLEGHTLDEHISMDKLLPVQKVIDIVHKVAVALDYAHRSGVVNRDVKPANIMLCENGDIKVMDFGLALNTKKNVNLDSTYINGLGSPAYMSPEQIKGYTLNHQTDLYSLGVMFYQLLTGRLPFRAKNSASLIYKIINTEPVPVNQLRPELPEFTHEVISRAMAKDLYTRYRLGAHLAKDLSDAPYQRVKVDPTNNLDARWKALRQLPILRNLDDIDVWELLRASTWRELPPAARIMQQGDEGKSFGFVVEGHIEIENGDRSVMVAARGDVIGAAEWLESDIAAERISSATTLDKAIYLEVNPSAFKYATEELAEEINRIVIDVVVGRLRTMTHLAGTISPVAVHPAPLRSVRREFDLLGESDGSSETPEGWGVFSAAEKAAKDAEAAKKAKPGQQPEAAPLAASARLQTVVARPMPAAAAAAIANAALNRTSATPFNLDSSGTSEFIAPPLSSDPVDLGAVSDHTEGARATTEMAPNFTSTTAFSTSEMAPNFTSTTAMEDATAIDAPQQIEHVAPDFDAYQGASTSEMAPNFSSTTAFRYPTELPSAPQDADADNMDGDASMATSDMAPSFSGTSAFGIADPMAPPPPPPGQGIPRPNAQFDADKTVMISGGFNPATAGAAATVKPEFDMDKTVQISGGFLPVAPAAEEAPPEELFPPIAL